MTWMQTGFFRAGVKGWDWGDPTGATERHFTITHPDQLMMRSDNFLFVPSVCVQTKWQTRLQKTKCNTLIVGIN